MTEEKTIREWLEELPDGYRERALKNYDTSYHDGYTVNCLSGAILETCHWKNSTEGFDFWNAVYMWAQGKGELPPLPEGEK